MSLRRPSSIYRLLIVFCALAALTVAASLLPFAALDWERICDSREHEIASGYQYARALIQERLVTARLLAEQAGRQDQPTSGVSPPATVLVVAADGRVLETSSGRTLPRLSKLVGGLLSAPASGIEIDDAGSLVAVGTFPRLGRLTVAALPFTDADAQAIKEATGLESSFFAGRARVATTLAAVRGQPTTAIPLSATDWNALTGQAGRLRWGYEPALASQPFLQVQVPLYGLDGSLVGAYTISRSWANHWSLLVERVWIWVGVLFAGMSFIALLTFWFGQRLLGSIGRLQRDLAALAVAPDARGLTVHSDLAELDALAQRANQMSADQAVLIRKNERLSEQLIQSQTLAALGQLAAGVAHDLNNPLTTIMGLADIIQTGNMEPDARRDLNVIRRQAERSGRIVRSLLSFARRQRADPQWVSINDLISQTLELLAYQARVNNIRCEAHLDRDLPLTWADPSQMQQVLFNLINNAMQAMATAHGRGNLRLESWWSPPTAGAPHGKITVRVQDDGPGIAEEILPRLFQPYFTTKEPGAGTGLGLAISASVVRRHSGRIWAENNPAGGASFVVELPVTPEPPQAVTAAVPSVAATANGTVSILLADSDPQRVSLLARILRRQGHQLSTAGDGLLAQSKMELEPFDLVLCGLELSRLDGRDLYAWTRVHRPEMAGRFVFIVGGTVTGEAEGFLQSTHAPVLWPPFQEDMVNAVVAQALHPPADAPSRAAQAS